MGLNNLRVTKPCSKILIQYIYCRMVRQMDELEEESQKMMQYAEISAGRDEVHEVIIDTQISTPESRSLWNRYSRGDIFNQDYFNKGIENTGFITEMTAVATFGRLQPFLRERHAGKTLAEWWIMITAEFIQLYQERGIGLRKILKIDEWDKEIGVNDKWACVLRLYEQFGDVWREGSGIVGSITVVNMKNLCKWLLEGKNCDLSNNILRELEWIQLDITSLNNFITRLSRDIDLI